MADRAMECHWPPGVKIAVRLCGAVSQSHRLRLALAAVLLPGAAVWADPVDEINPTQEVLIPRIMERDRDGTLDDNDAREADEAGLGVEVDQRQSFDDLVFSNSGANAGAAARRRLDMLLRRQLAEIRSDAATSPAQYRKLELAARGDIKHLFDRIDDCRRRYESAQAGGDEHEIEKLTEAAERIRFELLVKPFGEKSLLFKTLRHSVTHEQLGQFEALREVKRVRGQAIRQTDEARNAVEIVRLSGGAFDDRGLARLAALTDLTELYLDSTRVTDAGLRHLATMNRLEVLDLKATAVSDEGIAKLATLASLKKISLQGTRVSDTGLVRLQPLKKLVSLNLGLTDITDAGLARLNLAAFPHLAELSLAHTRITNVGLAQLQRAPGLERLHLNDTGISDAGLVHLSGCSQLRMLVLEDAPITDASLAHIQKLNSLEFLDLSGTDVTDAGLVALRGLKNLRFLDLDRTAVTPVSVESLKKALPDLGVLK